jgi:hypothetical protein
MIAEFRFWDGDPLRSDFSAAKQDFRPNDVNGGIIHPWCIHAKLLYDSDTCYHAPRYSTIRDAPTQTVK